MLQSEQVTVKILNLAGNSGGCACGSMSANPEYVALIHQKLEELQGVLEERFPRQTKVVYVDLNQSPAEKDSEVGQLLVTKQYPPPLVVINGEPKFAGSIITNKILKEVEKILNA